MDISYKFSNTCEKYMTNIYKILYINIHERIKYVLNIQGFVISGFYI
jgi:hypothetical protein